MDRLHVPHRRRLTQAYVTSESGARELCLGATEEIQAAINTLLDRTPARRPLTVRDLQVNFTMYGGSIARFPYLFDRLEDELGIHVECTADIIQITDLGLRRTESDPPRYTGTLAGAP